MMESLWSSMQIELLNRKKRRTRLDLANAIFDYIEIFLQPSEAAFADRLCITDRVRVTLREPIRSGSIFTAPRVTKLRTGHMGLIVSSRVCSRTDCLELGRSELSEARLPTFAMVGPLDPSHDRILSSCLVCSSFPARKIVTRCRRSGSSGLFGDLIPHPESSGEFGAVGGGAHPVTGRAEMRGDTAERGEEPLR